MIDKIYDMVLSDRRTKLREIFEATGVPKGTIISILHDKLALTKISARWVPRFLSAGNRHNLVVTSKALFARMRRNPNEFLHRFVTVDETWMHHYTLEMKKQSKWWIVKGEPAPKKVKTVEPARKVMATVFGIHAVSFTEKGQTLTGQYYALLLGRLSEKKRKRVYFKRQFRWLKLLN